MKFILSSELGRLAKWLKILDYDSYCFKGSNTALISRAIKESRTVLSSKSSVYFNPKVNIFIVKSQNLKAQLKELRDNFSLEVDSAKMFLRCIKCNIEFKVLSREEARGKIPQGVYNSGLAIYKCPKCKKLYWYGSHKELAKRYLKLFSG